MTAISPSRSIGVVGAGTMGAGIAQLAAAAGHKVLLYDAFDGAAEKGRAGIARGLGKLVSRGKMNEGQAAELLARIEVVATLDAFRDAALVIEAIVEDLGIKRQLFADLEKIVADSALLASNTSSISVTSIARDLRLPGRMVGMHFFNPAPVMKLVEVISGIATQPDAARCVFATAEAWGKVAVYAKSTPGFIVNRVARAYYAEPLRLLEEQLADPATLDALMTEGAGFRMGPFALMDLIGNDVNYAVSQSVFDAYYQEPRFRPSALQLELVNAGRLGRKSGRGFYDHGPNATPPAPRAEVVRKDAAPLDGVTMGKESTHPGLRILPSNGRTAHDLAAEHGVAVIVTDLIGENATRMAFAASSDVDEDMLAAFVAALSAQGVAATRLADWPGLCVMRTIAMLANEAFETVLQGVAAPADVDAAMRYGVNYPLGPLEWARRIGLPRVLDTLDNIHALTGDPRYRASLGLRMAARDG